MVKKVVTVVVMFLILCTLTVLAGNIPESLMLGEQKALFIGELVSTNEQGSIVKPLTIMMGNIPTEEISVESIDKYYDTEEVPTAGDFIVVVVLSDNDIDNFWLFKATSSDHKTLELVSDNFNMVERYQEYINTGAYFEAQKRFDEKTETSSQTTRIENTDENKQSIEYSTEKDGSNNKTNYSVIFGALLLITFMVYKLKKK
ncbi:MAG: hypothetical protein ACLKAO_10190 [Alkaliphilus sp.]